MWIKISRLFSIGGFLFLLFSAPPAQAIDFSKINTSYWYSFGPHPQVNFRVTQQQDQLTVFFLMQTPDQVRQYSVRWAIQKDFQVLAERSITPAIDTLEIQDRSLLLSLTFKATEDKLLVADINKNGEHFYFPQLLERGTLSFPSYYPVSSDGLPMVKKVVTEPIASFKGVDSLFAYQYKDNFKVADPPMGVLSDVSPSLDIKNKFLWKDGKDSEPYHFYFFQTDTTSASGITLYAAPEYYPEFRRLEELIRPILYISRNTEYRNIINSDDQKSAFDQFWLKVFTTKGNARVAIRNYYRKVAGANEFFTSYKEGWKTDRGIIYVVFGPPKEVYRGNREEVWLYDNGLDFQFRILPNLFNPEMYVLLRDPAYRQIWVDQVGFIRGDY
jgi:GWxTD domain-containing protein